MIILTLTEEKVNLILAALSELPVKISLPLIQEIQNEGHSQLKLKEKENEGTEEDKP